MFRPAGSPRSGGHVRRLTLTAFVVALSGAAGPPPAAADDGKGHYNRIRQITGNGKFNKNYASVLSPTVNRGLQQISSTNVSGTTNNQTAFCHRRHRVCKISQRLFDP